MGNSDSKRQTTSQIDQEFDKLIIPNEETEEQQYLRVLINQGLQIYNGKRSEERKKIYESIKDLIYRYNFVNPRIYYTISSQISDNKENFFGYKLVRILRKNGELDMDCVALIEIGIERVANSITGKLLQASELISGEKYCSRTTVLRSVWIIGPGKSVSDMINVGKEIKLVSNYDINFEYNFGEKIIEPNFGQPGKGCVQGINFFIDKKSALKYLRTGFASIGHKCLASSSRMGPEFIENLAEGICKEACPIEKYRSEQSEAKEFKEHEETTKILSELDVFLTPEQKIQLEKPIPHTVEFGSMVGLASSSGDILLRGIRVAAESKSIKIIDEEIVLFVLKKMIRNSSRSALNSLVKNTFKDFYNRSYLLNEHRHESFRESVWLNLCTTNCD